MTADASACGVEALSTMVAGFPAGLGASVLVVVHLPPGVTSALPAILDRTGPLPTHRPDMPGHAVRRVTAHHVVPAAHIGTLLASVPSPRPASDQARTGERVEA